MIFRDKYPQIHKYFPGGKPEYMLVQVLKTSIEENGEVLYMSEEIEDFIASGKNYEHSGGSVHQTNLELCFWLKGKWETIARKYHAEHHKEVLYLFCLGFA